MKTTTIDNQEIDSLVKLLDDNDEEVVSIVTQKLISMGPRALALLHERLLEGDSLDVSVKVISICQEINHNILVTEFKDALKDIHQSEGMTKILFQICKIEYEDLEWEEFEKPILHIQKLLWLETPPQLTNFEKTYLLSKILYEYLHYEFVALNYNRSQDFQLWNLLKTKKGNAFSLLFMFLLFAEFLHIPIAPCSIPNHMLLTKLENNKYEEYKYAMESNLNEKDLLFFIDPALGTILNLQQVKKFIFEHTPKGEMKHTNVRILPMKNLLKHYLLNLKKSYVHTQQEDKGKMVDAFMDCL